MENECRRIGFTATRHGLAPPQLEALERFLLSLQQVPDEFRHGDCVGGDCQGHYLIRRLFGFTKPVIHSHPPIKKTLRAYCPADVIHEPKPYLVRDMDIVIASNVLIGCPYGGGNTRSGTWTTIGYARDRKIPRIIILSTGEIVEEAD